MTVTGKILVRYVTSQSSDSTYNILYNDEVAQLVTICRDVYNTRPLEGLTDEVR